MRRPVQFGSSPDGEIYRKERWQCKVSGGKEFLAAQKSSPEESIAAHDHAGEPGKEKKKMKLNYCLK